MSWWRPALIGFLMLLGACALPQGFSMYPEILRGDEALSENTAVILVGIFGARAVNYLQFGHSTIPAINARFSDRPQANTIVAVPLPVGIKQLSLGVYTAGGAGYLPSGASFGFVGVHTPPIDITTPGLYYLASIFTDKPGTYSLQPDPAQLHDLRARLTGPIAALPPVNFHWPP